MQKIHHSWHVIRNFHPNVFLFCYLIKMFRYLILCIYDYSMLLVFLYSSMNECFLRTYRKQNKKKYTRLWPRNRHTRRNIQQHQEVGILRTTRRTTKKSKLSSLEKFLMCVCFSETKKKDFSGFSFPSWQKKNVNRIDISEDYSWSSSSSSSPLSSAPLSADAPAAAFREFDLPADTFESITRKYV
jgi:hypothetical protein